jgi:glutamate---cysteine ligase / carboxylate-amine ligase
MSDFRFGLEEEYFIVDRRSGTVCCSPPVGFMRASKRKLGPSLMYELLQSQIEVATHPHSCADDARSQLSYFRRTLSEVGKTFNVGIVAAGSHPLALPMEQRVTQKRRYEKIIDDLGMVALANPLCGLHAHVEVPEPDRRVDLMYRLAPFLPLFLALSTSSPFWSGCETGLLGYRNAANDMMPRSGLPETFQSLADYQSYVQALVETGIIPDSTHIWWALRPSLKHPTLELRICDCCTSVDDAVAIASLYRAIVRHLVGKPHVNSRRDAVSRALIAENLWRAQRYGLSGTLIDERTRKTLPFEAMLARLVADLAADIAALGIEREIAHLRVIALRGTSAHRQLSLYRDLRNQGAPQGASMRTVSQWLQDSTESGDFMPHDAYCELPTANTNPSSLDYPARIQRHPSTSSGVVGLTA